MKTYDKAVQIERWENEGGKVVSPAVFRPHADPWHESRNRARPKPEIGRAQVGVTRGLTRVAVSANPMHALIRRS